MKAWVCERYGPPDVLSLRDVPDPTVGDQDVLVRVRATTVSAGDWRVRSLTFPRGFRVVGRLMLGVSRPRQPILGTELAGTVESVGKDVTRFRPGDEVVAYPGAAMGAHAELARIPQRGAIVARPSRLSLEQAAALSFGGTTALHFLRRAGVAAGERLLVNGASGAVGTALVQLASDLGAEVTGVCSARNVDLVRSLGAAHVIDYTREDFTTAGVRYDVIADTAGTAPYRRSSRALTDEGRLIVINGSMGSLLGAPLVGLVSRRRAFAGPAAETPEYVQQLAQLAEAGRYTPVVDRVYPFGEMVEAHRYVDQGHKRGSVVVTL